MSRGELIKKYLAVKAHVECSRPTPAPKPDNGVGSRGVDAGLAKAWADMMRKQMDFEKDREVCAYCEFVEPLVSDNNSFMWCITD